MTYTAEAAYERFNNAQGFTGAKDEVGRLAMAGAVDFWRSHGYVTSKKEPNQSLLMKQCKRYARTYVLDRYDGKYRFVPGVMSWLLFTVLGAVITWFIHLVLDDTFAAKGFAGVDPQTAKKPKYKLNPPPKKK